MTSIIYSKDFLTKPNEIQCIQYHCRIHFGNCRCQKIISIIHSHSDYKPICVIEKLWNDDEYKQFPEYVLIVNNGTTKQDEEEIIKILFKKSYQSRKEVYNYFRDYDWSLEESIKIRNLMKSIKSANMCLGNLIINDQTCNAGFVIIGNRKQMKTISSCFNKYITKREFSEIAIVKIKNLNNISEENRDYSLRVLMQNPIFKTLNNKSYVIVGKKYSTKLNNIKYSFSFGKREWFHDTIETSFQCATRELYEEFNIQFSKEWYFNSIEKSSYIRSINIKDYSILYFLYLDENIPIWFHTESETIYIGEINSKNK